MTLPHLDDDALSAALDGLAADGEVGHLAGCDPCRQRLEALRDVARAVGAPVVADPPAVVDARIRLALDAAARDTAAARDAAGRDTAAGPIPAAPTVGPARTGPDGAFSPLPNRQRGRAHRRSTPGRGRLLTAAAVVAAVLGLAGLVAALGRSGPSASKSSTSAEASRPLAGPATTAAGAAEGRGPATGGLGGSGTTGGTGHPAAAAPAPGGAVVEGPDLGQQSDPATLTQQLKAIVATLLQPAGAGFNPAAGGVAQAAQPCAAQGIVFARLSAQAAVLRYAATLRYQGVDAVALIYARSGGWTAVVMGSGGCGGLLLLPSV